VVLGKGEQMKSTLRITGKPREFFEPETTALATKRINASKELMKELAEERRQGFPGQSSAQVEDTMNRYQEAQAAMKWWQEILDEE